MNIAIGSSTQIAMFVAPVLVFASLLLGHPLTYIFTVPEMTAIGFSVIITTFIAGDGKCHWLEGAQLLAAYAIMPWPSSSCRRGRYWDGSISPNSGYDATWRPAMKRLLVSTLALSALAVASAAAGSGPAASQDAAGQSRRAAGGDRLDPGPAQSIRAGRLQDRRHVPERRAEEELPFDRCIPGHDGADLSRVRPLQDRHVRHRARATRRECIWRSWRRSPGRTASRCMPFISWSAKAKSTAWKASRAARSLPLEDNGSRRLSAVIESRNGEGAAASSPLRRVTTRS